MRPNRVKKTLREGGVAIGTSAFEFASPGAFDRFTRHTVDFKNVRPVYGHTRNAVGQSPSGDVLHR